MSESETVKRIIRIIQDYCYKLGHNWLVSEFALTVSPKIALKADRNELTHEYFIYVCQKRKDFFVANRLDVYNFLRNLYKHLKTELSYYIFTSFEDSLLEYKRRMENGSLKGFPKQVTSEDTLRSDLSNYINYENFCEPRCGTGNCDIIIPAKKIIIETKIWKGREYYNSGLPELKEYLIRQGYSKGCYIIYDYNKSDNIIIKENGENFYIKEDNINIFVMFIRMNRTSPSKIYKESKITTK